MMDDGLLPQVEIHEIEERKNLHVNDLMRSHEAAFHEIKKYYNDITRDNLKLIRLLKVRSVALGVFCYPVAVEIVPPSHTCTRRLICCPPVVFRKL